MNSSRRSVRSCHSWNSFRRKLRGLAPPQTKYLLLPILNGREIGFKTLLIEHGRYFTWLRESAWLWLGKNETLIYKNIKNTIAFGDQFRLYPHGFLQFCRQTGGHGFIVSLRAIINLNFKFQGVPPPVRSGEFYPFLDLSLAFWQDFVNVLYRERF